MTGLETLLRVAYVDKYGNMQVKDGIEKIPSLGHFKEEQGMVLGIDPATKHLGMALATHTGEVVALFDIINMGFPDKESFRTCYLEFMQNNMPDLNITHTIYEIPVEASNNRTALQALNVLRDFISRFPKYIPNWRDIEMTEVNNYTWKTHFLANPKYKGRRKSTSLVKQAVMEEAYSIYPWTGDYSHIFRSPADSFDAVGIIHGTLAEIYPSGDVYQMRQVNKTMPVMRTLKPAMLYVHATLEEVESAIFKTAGNIIRERGAKAFYYNASMPLEENCKRYCAAYNEVGLLYVSTPKARQIVKWEMNTDVNDDEQLIICTYRVRVK